jgi:hypothetical protein
MLMEERRPGRPSDGLCTTGSKAGRFVTLEIRIIATEKEALQPLGIPEYVLWHAFPFHFKEVEESVYSSATLR